MKIWHIRNKRQDYVIVDNKLILDQSGEPKRHKGKIIATLVLLEDKIGWAICCPEDRFSKKVGVSIAMGRAKSQKQMPIPAKLLKHVKKMANKYEVKLPEQPEIETPALSRELYWEDVKEGTVLTVQMEYDDDPQLFISWGIKQADINTLNGRVEVNENMQKIDFETDPMGAFRQFPSLIPFPPELFGIKQ